MKDNMYIVKPLNDSKFLVQGITQTIEKERKEERSTFCRIL